MIKLIITTFLFFSVQSTNAFLYDGFVDSNGNSIIPEQGLIKVVFRSHMQQQTSLEIQPTVLKDSNGNDIHFSTGNLELKSTGSHLRLRGQSFTGGATFNAYLNTRSTSNTDDLLLMKENLVFNMTLFHTLARTALQPSYCQLFGPSSLQWGLSGFNYNTFNGNFYFQAPAFECQAGVSKYDSLLGKISVRYNGYGLTGTGTSPDPPLFEVYLLGDIDTDIPAAHSQLKEFLKCLKSIKYGLENNLHYFPGSTNTYHIWGPRFHCGGALLNIN